MKITSQRFLVVLQCVSFWLSVCGSVHAVDPYKLHVLHNFLGKPAYAPSSSLIMDGDGNLYGETLFTAGSKGHCGKFRCGGEVFELTRNSSGEWIYSILHVFKGHDGASPVGSLILDHSGNLYGTTQGGGTNGYGTVFELSHSSGKWAETVLYNFRGGPYDLDTPGCTLIFDPAGNLYGTASDSQTDLLGGVFKLSPSKTGWTETILYKFAGSDGSEPVSGVRFDQKGNIYGTTLSGGQYGYGVVFELLPKAGRTWSESVLHSFTGGSDGANPTAGVILDSSDNLYGTTVDGGDDRYCDGGGCGTVFELSNSNGTWEETVLYAFTYSDGAFPYFLLFDPRGNLYSTTTAGGAESYGTAFRLSKARGTWTFTNLYSFTVQDGPPAGGLILDAKGRLYGTAALGGKAQDGIVFRLAP